MHNNDFIQLMSATVTLFTKPVFKLIFSLRERKIVFFYGHSIIDDNVSNHLKRDDTLNIIITLEFHWDVRPGQKETTLFQDGGASLNSDKEKNKSIFLLIHYNKCTVFKLVPLGCYFLQYLRLIQVMFQWFTQKKPHQETTLRIISLH